MIEADTPARKRAEILNNLESGRTRVVTNVAVWTEGFDCPALGAILLCRPTLSKVLHLQMLGRGMRPAPGKPDCLVLDHADNLRKHGFPEEPQAWTLEGQDARQIRARIENAPPKTKKCPACFALVPTGTQICPHCGHVTIPQPVPAQLVRLYPRSDRQSVSPGW